MPRTSYLQMKTLPKIASVIFCLCSVTLVLHAQVPQMINYQGRVLAGSTNFDGSGQFKFALVNAAGTTTYWSNNNSSVNGSEPSAAVTLTVTKGLYSVLLGDTSIANMTLPIPSSVFTNSDVRLRVWFNDGTHNSQLLTPDQRITAVGYALMASDITDGAITSAKLANGAVTNAAIGFGAVGTSQLQTGLNLGGTTTGIFSGNGASLTSLNATNIGSGTILNARTTGTSTNTPSTLVLRDGSGNFSAGTITASFSGSGSALTSLNAANIASGGTLPALNGSALTSLNAANISGIIPNASTTGTSANTPNTLVLRDANGSFSTGSVGVGTATPAKALDVTANVAALAVGGSVDPSVIVRLTNSSNTGNLTTPNVVGIGFGRSATQQAIIGGTFGNDYLDFFTGAALTAPKMRIASSGNVGIGTTTPANKLDVQGSANFTGNVGIGTTTPTATLDVAGTIKGTFSGSGAALTNLDASSISTGILANSRTTADTGEGGIGNHANTIALRDSTGFIHAAGYVGINASDINIGILANSRTTADTGEGGIGNHANTIALRDSTGFIHAAGYVGINASDINIGILANSRTTADTGEGGVGNHANTIALRDSTGFIHAAGYIGINASDINTGTLANSRTTADTGEGGVGNHANTIALRDSVGFIHAAGYVGVNASDITTGTLPAAQLPATVALETGGNSFTGFQTLTGNFGVGKTQAAGAGNSSFLEFNDSTGGFRGLYGVDGNGFSGTANQFTIGTWTNHPLAFYTNQTQRMKIGADGLVGIATTATHGRLEVGSSGGSYTMANPYPGFNVTNTAGFLSNYPPGTFGAFIYSNGDVVTTGSFLAISDERVKNIIGRSDSASDLSTLLGIEITDYRYKDVIAHGDAPFKKVIAQQVEKVFPQAVTKQTGEVPDIYKLATIKDGWIALATDLKQGERVKLITDEAQGVYEVMEVRGGAFRTEFKPATEKVFVYGREVKDFRSVDYESLAMLNVSATQEMQREIESLRANLVSVEKAKDTEITTLKERLARQEKQLAALETRDKEREARLTRLEISMPATQPVANTIASSKTGGQ